MTHKHFGKPPFQIEFCATPSNAVLNNYDHYAKERIKCIFRFARLPVGSRRYKKHLRDCLKIAWRLYKIAAPYSR